MLQATCASKLRVGLMAAAAVVALGLAISPDKSWAQASPTPAASQEVASAPCLQALNDQKAKDAAAPPKKPGFFSRNADKILGGVGVVAGVVIANNVCNQQNRGDCRVIGGILGGLLGSKLGRMLSEADRAKYDEAVYKVAMTGRPMTLNLANGCAVVEAKSDEIIEQRDIELALGPNVAAPEGLKTLATAYARPSQAPLLSEPKTAGKAAVTIGPNTPSFVMGSTQAGKWLLVGREDPDQGYVAAGYVAANGWNEMPESTPVSPAGANTGATLTMVKAEVPCRQISSSIRVDATQQQETFPAKICRLPTGVAEAS